MVKALWNGEIIASSDECIVVEGNQYFPPESLNMKFFKENKTHSTCPWKGEASYYNLEVNGEENSDAAWYYPKASEAASSIENYVAFWKGVEIQTS